MLFAHLLRCFYTRTYLSQRELHLADKNARGDHFFFTQETLMKLLNANPEWISVCGYFISTWLIFVEHYAIYPDWVVISHFSSRPLALHSPCAILIPSSLRSCRAHPFANKGRQTALRNASVRNDLSECRQTSHSREGTNRTSEIVTKS